MEKEEVCITNAPIQTVILHLNRELRKCGYEEILSMTFADEHGARYSYQCSENLNRRHLYY